MRRDKISGLICIQTVWTSDGITEKNFKQVNYKKSADDKNMQNFPTGRVNSINMM